MDSSQAPPLQDDGQAPKIASPRQAPPTGALPFAARFLSAVRTLNLASASYDIWRVYAGKETRDCKTMGKLPDFFIFDQEAHFRNIIVCTYTLYDTHAQTITIKSLIHDLPSVAAKPIWRKYRAIQDAVKKITHLRHNTIAHRNMDQTTDEIFKEAGLKPDDLQKLILDSLGLLTMIAHAVGAEPPLVSSSAGDETMRLLRRLKASYQET